MPLEYVDQNLFDSPAQVLVNTVNTVGVMGKGIALEYKKLYPEMFKEYQEYCQDGSLTVGKLYLFKSANKWILNFPTKENWRSKSKIEYIESGLKKFVETYADKGIESISFPQLGVGNGGLDWDKQVKPLMEKYLSDLPINIYIHIYTGWQNHPEYVKQIKKALRKGYNSVLLDEFKSDFIDAFEGSEEGKNLNIQVMEESDDLPDNEIFVTFLNDELYLSQQDIIDVWGSLFSLGKIYDEIWPMNITRSKNFELIKSILSKIDYIELISTTFLDNSSSRVPTLRQSGLLDRSKVNVKRQPFAIHDSTQLDIWRDK
ncbi:macro domain-containing protein [Companilactobacillus ginsenosidimutans]|uniref:macro domain-containing protein n=1 Tax=Companilactobacillus ginsenosidimutans TaxID=1007676 RepID=UPI00069F0659|nr:macro domain-containing protein [Companilactobacillus ginsenosidimutans]